MPTIPPFFLVGHVTISVERPPAGSYVKGRWYIDPLATSTIFDIKANVQPLIGNNKKQLLPEGDRSKEAITLWSHTNTKVVQQGVALQKGDIVTWKGAKWEVKSALQYEMGVLDHTESIAVKFEKENPQP